MDSAELARLMTFVADPLSPTMSLNLPFRLANRGEAVQWKLTAPADSRIKLAEKEMKASGLNTSEVAYCFGDRCLGVGKHQWTVYRSGAEKFFFIGLADRAYCNSKGLPSHNSDAGDAVWGVSTGAVWRRGTSAPSPFIHHFWCDGIVQKAI